MKYRVLTLAREFGSGGAAIARIVAERLGWRLLDNALVQQIAKEASVDPALARLYDEQVDSWAHRVSRLALWRGAFESVASVTPAAVFDARTVAELASGLIREAYEQGHSVIVGRGAQCVLQAKPDVFHVFVYAPWNEKVARVRGRLSEAGDVEDLIPRMDRQREQYVRTHFNVEWKDPHLYHLLICSSLGEWAAASVILEAMDAS